ncbi:MAG: hypothetical protein WC788_03830 [Candidatus Paceibacterota bacterium]|jgi:hypothetical protein
MNKRTLIFAFIAISAVTTYVYLFDVEFLRNVDTVNHFIGGVLLAALMPKGFRIKKPLHAFLAATFVFVGWEFLEIYLTSGGIYPKLFEETVSNRVQDVVLDYLGYAIFFIKPEKHRP